MTGLLREWVKAIGFPQLIFIFILLVILVWSGPNLAIPQSDSFDYLLLETIRLWIPDSLEPIFAIIYKLSGIPFTGLLVISLLFYFIFKRFWVDFICLFVSRARYSFGGQCLVRCVCGLSGRMDATVVLLVVTRTEAAAASGACTYPDRTPCSNPRCPLTGIF